MLILTRIVHFNKNCALLTPPPSGLSEPSGLSYDPYSGQLYIADTNNHCVRVVDGDQGVRELNLVERKRKSKQTTPSFVSFAVSSEEDVLVIKCFLVIAIYTLIIVFSSTVLLSQGDKLKVKLEFSNKLNKEGSSSVQITSHAGVKCGLKEVDITEPQFDIPVEMGGERGAIDLLVTVRFD